jgi:hypothetical protein
MQNWAESENSQLIQSSESVAECLSDRDKFDDMIGRCDFVGRRASCLGATGSDQGAGQVDTVLILTMVAVSGLSVGLVVASVWFVLKKKRKGDDRRTQKVYFWVCLQYCFTVQRLEIVKFLVKCRKRTF